jgi:hypothetical protein
VILRGTLSTADIEISNYCAELTEARYCNAVQIGQLETLEMQRDEARKQLEIANRALNTPEIHDFTAGVISEAQHQRARWGPEHDAGKQPEDWFWLLGYLGGKCLAAQKAGDVGKALHHTISTAACLANWHASMLGKTDMRPGIDTEESRALSQITPTDKK